MRIRGRALIAAATMALSMVGCGGGGDDVAAGPGPVGLWNGTTNETTNGTTTSRPATALTLGDGTYWLLYSGLPGGSVLPGGFVQGHLSSSSSMAFSSSDMRDFNFEDTGVTFGSLTGVYVPRTSIQVGAAYSDGTQRGFSGTYDALNERRASLTELAGTYTGQVLLSSGDQSGSVTIGTDGAVVGNAGGCAVTGRATARTDAYAYSLALRFGPAPCYFAGQSFTGIAVFDPGTNQLIAASPNAARSDGILFVGTKPN